MPRIWIIEDHDTIRECLKTFLSLEGFEVHAFAEGGGALQCVLEDPERIWADLVLLDLYTNAMSAQEFVQSLNSLALQLQRALPKVCVVSGAADIENISRLLNADFFFQKPFDTLELIQYAKRVCSQTAIVG